LKTCLSDNFTREREAHIHYGDSGSKEEYSVLEDQDYDWDVDRTDLDRNGTGSSRG